MSKSGGKGGGKQPSGGGAGRRPEGRKSGYGSGRATKAPDKQPRGKDKPDGRDK